ncbi:MAG: methionine--tRNA ligase subunit beta [Promethearchaeota archaeon]
MISYDDFAKMDLRVGKVLSCEEIPKSRSLYKLMVDVGEEQPRTILSGIKNWYSVEDLVDKFIIVLLNLKPRKMMGIESQGMLLAADVDDAAVLLKTDDTFKEKLKPGQKIQ